MTAKASIYLPYVFRSFQGFSVKDIKEFCSDQLMVIELERQSDTPRLCGCCGHALGALAGRYRLQARHLRVFN